MISHIDIEDMDEGDHTARQAAALDDPGVARGEDMTDAQDEAPARIRVARDADGFWTCREAVSGSPEYVRSDLARPSQAGDERVARLESIVRRFVALPCGAWHPERHAADEAELMTDARAALAAMDTPKGGGDE